jgi:predicted ATPase
VSQEDRYRFRSKIGSGSFGELWLASDTLLDRPVAIKRLNATDDANLRDRFLNEARMLARLNHPNITQIYDVFFDQDNNNFYLVMEYVDGKDLSKLIGGGNPLPLDLVLDVAKGLLQALSYVHGRGMVHRDVKPANVMIADEVKLTDFGLASLKSILQGGTNFFAGTPAYMAPEQIDGQPLDGRADLYALGIMLFEMISGDRFPFAHAGQAGMLSGHLLVDPPPISQFAPTVPLVLEQTIMRLLAKDPEERYPSADALLEVIESIHFWPTHVPAFLDDEDKAEEHPQADFIGCERALAQLDGFLAKAISGDGRVVFVSGEPGLGKTTLVAEFSRRAQQADPTLLVAAGACDAYSGIGDPYLPFRDSFAMLAADVEALWEAGSISRAHAMRLWTALPTLVETLLSRGADLVSVLVDGQTLAAHAAVVMPKEKDWLEKLSKLTQFKADGKQDIQQDLLFEQCANVLQLLSKKDPLILILDDLQWADTASLSLLFHLGRRIADSRLLIIGTYRTDELALGRDRGRHPLEPVLNEFKRLFGDIDVGLDKISVVERQAFVDDFLDQEPNRLGPPFRQSLFTLTSGHPLYTVEVLRDMQERGDLMLDESGAWVEGPALDWTMLPARVEGVIEERIGRLDDELRQTLDVACVEGETFTAEVISSARSVEFRSLLRQLSSQLDRKHRLVSEHGRTRIGQQPLSVYAFRHNLYQQFLYNQLGESERAVLHEEVGRALEALYGEQRERIAAQLAWHFEVALNREKTIEYLQMAGEQARQRFANHQAIEHFRKALHSAEQMPAAETAVKRQTIHAALGELLTATGQYESAREHLLEVLELTETHGDRDGKVRACRWMARTYELRGEYAPSLEWIQKGLLAQELEETAETAELLLIAGLINTRQGEYNSALELCRQGLKIAQKLGELPVLARAYNLQGNIDRLLGHSTDSIKQFETALELYEQAEDLHGQALTQNQLATAYFYLNQLRKADQSYREALSIFGQIGDAYNQLLAHNNLGGIALKQGKLDEALGFFREALSMLEQIGGSLWVMGGLHLNIGATYSRQGRTSLANQHLQTSREHFEKGQVRDLLPEMHLRFAETALVSNDLDQADEHGRQAVDLSRELSMPGEEGSSLRVLGEIATIQGQYDLAEKHFEQSLSTLDEIGDKYEWARTQLSLSRLRANQHLRDASLAALELCIPIFERLDAKLDLTKAYQLRQQLSSRLET